MEEWFKKYGFSCMLIFWGIVASIFLICSVKVFCTTWNRVNSFHDYPSPANCSVKLEYSNLSDSIGRNTQKVSVDTSYVHRIDRVLQTVEQNQKQIVGRQDDLIADLRQETNNNIEKTTAWATLWITVMAFVGTLIPALLSVWTHHRDEKEKNKFENKIAEIEQKWNKLERSMIQELEKLQLSINVINLNNGLDNKIFDTIPNSLGIKKAVFDGIIKEFEDIVKFLEENADTEQEINPREVITSSLICIHSAIQSIQHHTPSMQNKLNVKLCQDQIYDILKEMYSATPDFSQTIYPSLHYLILNLHRLS